MVRAVSIRNGARREARLRALRWALKGIRCWKCNEVANAYFNGFAYCSPEHHPDPSRRRMS